MKPKTGSTGTLLSKPAAKAGGGKDTTFHSTSDPNNDKTLGRALVIGYIILLIILSISQVVSSFAQAPSKGLQTGDTIPEKIWHLPLQVAGHHENKSTITLNDYRGKLIILDFWATWCGSCVEALPKLEHLQEEFGDKVLILPVTSQSKAIVSAFFNKNRTGRELKLPVITDDKELAMLFPHKLLSHLVWIDASGKVKAFTWSEYATADNIRLVLSGKPLPWTMKVDVVSFRKERPLLAFSDNGAPPPFVGYHSAFTSHLPGVNTTSGMITDSTQNTVRRYDINVRLTALCVRAWNRPMPALSPKQYVYEVADRSRYVRPDSAYRDHWNRENTWCYEAVMPASFTKDQLAGLLKDDLKRYLNVEGYAEKRRMKCLVISAGGKHSRSAEKKTKTGMLLSDMIWQLNNHVPALPFAINETGGDELLPGINPSWYASLQSLEAALKERGLVVSLLEREVDVFVIHELDR
ncbi:TlpA family protein disulfide reductase [Arcticibacter tournemirensis]|uniref:TlpA family protein disulfide reductase n=1 Tax=Arcticibacter tournemirensis TaxID=699437 RepID=A0A4Q0MB98_9SPHI|nr:TlpA disulfide reductase family protein [Arcticibacter tournemirensis]RXF70086.1 TlpA family protein disulfide reductase [Arcticibacter tournemirensis]